MLFAVLDDSECYALQLVASRMTNKINSCLRDNLRSLQGRSFTNTRRELSVTSLKVTPQDYLSTEENKTLFGQGKKKTGFTGWPQ